MQRKVLLVGTGILALLITITAFFALIRKPPTFHGAVITPP
jgi:hypothetical protein